MTEVAARLDANQVLAALGDATRRALIDLLAQSPSSISDLASALNVTKTAIGQHVAILEACHLVVSQKTGRVRICRLDHRGLDALQVWIEARRHPWVEKLDRLDDLLEEEDGVSSPNDGTTAGV
ncbi:metalloregulator ArsR/SmtB family transcription factor [bacterium]|nr:metalloregulator ArsR/SmtB family transcription factor [bacterium]